MSAPPSRSSADRWATPRLQVTRRLSGGSSKGMPPDRAVAALSGLHLEVEEEFETAQAEFCGALLGTRRDLGLSLGDCVCLTTAASLGAIAVTADRRWKELDGTAVNGVTIHVELIR